MLGHERTTRKRIAMNKLRPEVNLQDQAIPEGAAPRLAGLRGGDYPAYRQAIVDARLADVFEDSHLAERAPHRFFGR